MAWYMGERGDSLFSSATIVHADGTRPARCSEVPACPHCGSRMGPANMRRCFEEDIEPAFDLMDAWRNGKRVNPIGKPDPVAVAMLMSQRNKKRWLLGAMAAGYFVLLALAIWKN